MKNRKAEASGLTEVLKTAIQEMEQWLPDDYRQNLLQLLLLAVLKNFCGTEG